MAFYKFTKLSMPSNKIRYNRKAFHVLLLFAWQLCCIADAQPISLQASLDSALRNNLTINNERLKSDYAKALIQSAATLPSTQVSGEFGHFNSSYFDTKFSVSQSFALPGVYQRQKQLFTKEWEAALLSVSVKEYELKKAVTQTFYNHIYLQQKLTLLGTLDSMYITLLRRAAVRLQKGESNILEKTTFETQKTAIEIQAAQVLRQKTMVEELFQLLLNTAGRYIPSDSNFRVLNAAPFNLATIDEHPALRNMYQQQLVAKAITYMERAKLLPEILVGYNNMSIQGAESNITMHTTGRRYSSGIIGIGIPIFTSAQKARIKASHINEQIVAHNYTTEKQMLQNAYLQQLVQYQQNVRILELYQNQHSKNIKSIKETANRQFLNGEINYLEFVMLINQAITIESGYIDAINDYNHSAINLTYLLSR